MDKVDLYPSGLLADIWGWIKPDDDWSETLMGISASMDLVIMVLLTVNFMVLTVPFVVLIFVPIIFWKMYVWTQITHCLPFAWGLYL